MSTKQEIFSSIFTSEATREIPFNEFWSNGTGYFDNAVYGSHAPKLERGEVVKSMTPNNRRILIVGTRLGNVVVFDRYTGNESGVFVYNCTQTLESIYLIRNNSLSDDDMRSIFGLRGCNANIGLRIEQLYTDCSKFDKK